MPFADQYPNINGHEMSWSSIDFVINGVPLAGIVAFTVGEKIDPQIVMGAGNYPLGATRGNVSYNGEMEVLEKTWKLLKLTLGTAGKGYGESFFPCVATYHETADDPVIVDRCWARIIDEQKARAQGSAAATVKLSLLVIKADLDGSSILFPANTVRI